MKTIKTIAIALMFTAFAAGVARAEDKQDKPAGVLDDNSLKTMLENLGYEPKPIKYQNGRTGQRIKVAFKGFDAEMDVSLSANNANVWGVLNVAELKSEHHADGSRFIKILQLNLTHGPCHFRISKDGKYITLARGMTNRIIVAKDLKGHIDDLLSTAEQTAEYWDTSKWTAQPPAPAPKSVIMDTK